LDATPQPAAITPIASETQTLPHPGASLVAAEPSHIHIPRPSRLRRAVLADQDADADARVRLRLALALDALENAA
jgi:hypothetical protein